MGVASSTPQGEQEAVLPVAEGAALPQPVVLSRDVLASSRFLSFVSVSYKQKPADEDVRQWQYVERTTRNASGVDAVNVFGVLKKAGTAPQVLCVTQYRPPLAKTTIELPAGLVDVGETPEQTALRELKEETGYTAKVVARTGVQCLSPGLTNETMVTIFAEIDGDAPENQDPQQSAEDRKMGVRRVWLPLAGLANTLARMERDRGLAVFAGLYSIAHGLALRDSLASMSV